MAIVDRRPDGTAILEQDLEGMTDTTREYLDRLYGTGGRVSAGIPVEEFFDDNDDELTDEQLQRMGINTSDLPEEPLMETWSAATTITIPQDGRFTFVANDTHLGATTLENMFEHAPSLRVEGESTFNGRAGFNMGLDVYNDMLVTGRVDFINDVFLRDRRLQDVFEEYNTRIIELEEKVRRLEEENG